MAGQEKQSKGSKAGRNKTCVVYKAEDRRLRNKLRRLVTYLNRNYRRAKSKRETGIDNQAGAHTSGCQVRNITSNGQTDRGNLPQGVQAGRV